MDLKKKAEFTGDKEPVLKEVTIDSGADTSIIDKTTAEELGLKSTGKRTTLASFDGNETKAEICTGHVRIDGTCCEAKTEFAVVDDSRIPDGPIIGKDFISKVGMRIDGSKKDDSNTYCDCGKVYTKMRAEVNKFNKRRISG